MDEADKVSSSQLRKLNSESLEEIYVDMSDVVLRTKKKSKESLSPLAKSEDLVDEELANMEHAESLDILSPNVCNNIPLQYAYYFSEIFIWLP